MSWSLRLATVAGIGIFVHWTFLLLLAYVAYMHQRSGDTLAGILEGIGFIIAIFACIVLHELGHALTARRYGIQTRDITLLPIGGVARLMRIPEVPMQEFWVAVAGPAVNIVISAILFAVLWASGTFGGEYEFGKLLADNFLVRLMAVNIFLVLFNMLPAFPMDGGRVLRALLATRMSRLRATHIASTVGQAMAILFAVAGLMTGAWMLLFIAFFVYLGAQGEAQAAEMRAIFRGVAARDAMVVRFDVLSADETIERAKAELLAGHQQDFPVMHGEEVIGILRRDDIIRAIGEGREQAPVAEYMSDHCPALEANMPLHEASQFMQENECATVLVKDRGELVGLLTSENIGEWSMIQSALRDRNESSRA